MTEIKGVDLQGFSLLFQLFSLVKNMGQIRFEYHVSVFPVKTEFERSDGRTER